MISIFRTALRSRLVFAALLLLLAGCTTKVALYSALSEHEADDMLALLQRSGVNVEKTMDKTGATILVESQQVPQAMALLDNAGLPHPSYAKLGDLFAKQGLITSPTEESVRYLYGITEELSRTLSQIDGVLSARVHVVLPGNTPLGENNLPSSAAVLIRYAPDKPIEGLVPRIKELVINSIEGLTYDRVSVIMVKGPSQDVGGLQTTALRTSAIPFAHGRDRRWLYVVGGFCVLSILGNGALAFFLLRRKSGLRSTGGKVAGVA